MAKHAARQLWRRHLPEGLARHEQEVTPACQMPGGQLTSLRETLHRHVPERRSVKGLRHKQATVLTITFAVLLCGGPGGHRAVAGFMRGLALTQRAALRCWFNRRTRRYEVPTENCLYRDLKTVRVLASQQALWAWQAARHGACDGPVVVLDGSAQRGSGATQRGGAVNAQNSRALRVEPVANKSDEIPAAQTLLRRASVEEMLVAADALLTLSETARIVVLEKGADHLLTVKGNRKQLATTLHQLHRESWCAFSPSTPTNLRANAGV